MEMLMEMMQLQGNPSMMVNLFMFMMGLGIHVIGMMIEYKVSFKDYMMQHGGRTMLSFGTLIAAFMSASSLMPETSMLSYFMAGYMIDSIANKAPIKA